MLCDSVPAVQLLIQKPYQNEHPTSVLKGLMIARALLQFLIDGSYL